MRLNLFILIWLWLLADMAYGAEIYREVQIADSYIELRTGPGRGYPVFLVIERGEYISLLKRKTDWFKVRTANRQEGWVDRAQLELTLMSEGERTKIEEVAMTDFINHRWEAGVTGGDYGGASVITLYGGYAFTHHLSGELSLSQAVGEYSSSVSAKAGVLAYPFPQWRVSPFFTLGAGMISTDPHTTLVRTSDRNDPTANVGVGMQTYLTHRFVLRAEYNNYVVFSATNDHDHNEDIDEWKAGFAIFF